jgi:hypothetical protein
MRHEHDPNKKARAGLPEFSFLTWEKPARTAKVQCKLRANGRGAGGTGDRNPELNVSNDRQSV